MTQRPDSDVGTPDRQVAGAPGRVGRRRWLIALTLFAVSTVNYGDRGTLSLTGNAMQHQFGFSATQLGVAFSAFAWAYALGQLPGGWLLDRFGSKRVYRWSILAWSVFTLLHALVGGSTAAMALSVLFGLRLLVGLAESPSFPGNARIVAAWFPDRERGLASAMFNSTQYFGTVIFAPLGGWVIHLAGWRAVYVVMGLIGVLAALLWGRLIFAPTEHPRLGGAELDYIRDGGALVEMDARTQRPAGLAPLAVLRKLLRSRMLVGMMIGQYCFSAITYFLLTWFPVYLVQARGLSILQAGFLTTVPALGAFLGNMCGGAFSDLLLRRGVPLTAARKIPIVVGLVLTMTMVLCNYVSSAGLVIAVMALAFFGKGIGGMGWAVLSDVAPRQAGGLAASLFNTASNLAGIVTPIVIGLLVDRGGSFSGALVFVTANALVALVSYVTVVGPLRRLTLV